MSRKIFDWSKNPEYCHNGDWERKHSSIMNPGKKITFPQLMVEMLFYNRSRYLKTFPKIFKGPGWTKNIEPLYRTAIQQCYNICNYFPKADNNPIIENAIKNHFRNSRCVSIGSYRKHRITKKGNINISQAEKDIVKGIFFEIEKLSNKIDNIAVSCKEDHKPIDIIIEKKDILEKTKNKFELLLELEKTIEKKNE